MGMMQREAIQIKSTWRVYHMDKQVEKERFTLKYNLGITTEGNKPAMHVSKVEKKKTSTHESCFLQIRASETKKNPVSKM